MPRLAAWCDTATRVVIALLIVRAILAIASVYYRGRALIQMTAAVLGIIWSLRLLASRRDNAEIAKVESRNTNPSISPLADCRFPLAALGFLLAILLVLPLLALPPRVLRVLSPRAFAIAEQALPGWPARAPFDDLRRILDLQPARIAAAAQLPVAGAWRPLSLLPHDTTTTLSLGAAYVVVAALMAFYPWPNGGLAAVSAAVTCLIAIGIVEALYGVSQTTTGYNRLYWYECRSACMGSYLNRDHYAGLLEMIFPIALARAAAWYGTLRLEAGALRDASSLFRTRYYIDAFSSTIGRMICAAAVALILLVAMAVSGSRSAFGASIAALLIMVPLRPRESSPLLPKEGEGGGRVAGPLQTSPGPSLVRRGRGWRRSPFLSGGLTALAILWLTFPQLFGRFFQDDPGRPALAADTFNMALTFPLFGIGLGNFASVFPLFKRLTVDFWQYGVSDAHNDYLQWIAEAGMPAALLTFAVLIGSLIRLTNDPLNHCHNDRMTQTPNDSITRSPTDAIARPWTWDLGLFCFSACSGPGLSGGSGTPTPCTPQSTRTCA